MGCEIAEAFAARLLVLIGNADKMSTLPLWLPRLAENLSP